MLKKEAKITEAVLRVRLIVVGLTRAAALTPSPLPHHPPGKQSRPCRWETALSRGKGCLRACQRNRAYVENRGGQGEASCRDALQGGRESRRYVCALISTDFRPDSF